MNVLGDQCPVGTLYKHPSDTTGRVFKQLLDDVHITHPGRTVVYTDGGLLEEGLAVPHAPVLGDIGNPILGEHELE